MDFWVKGCGVPPTLAPERRRKDGARSYRGRVEFPAGAKARLLLRHLRHDSSRALIQSFGFGKEHNALAQLFRRGKQFNVAYNGDVLPDGSLGRTFYVVNAASAYSYPSTYDTVQAFDNSTYMPAGSVSIDFTTAEGANSSYTLTDVIRWGQDGIAILTSGGHIYLLRGPVVVPQLLNQNSTASLTSSSASTIAKGSGNTMLTLTGSNFVPGVAVTWNGSYRTTTIVDATHLSVAIPASDLAATGSGTIVATNPGAGA